jgi:hypothetical protein
MTTTQRVILVTVYAPKSVDPTESTVLTPVAGALHSDPLRIANARGYSGFQPYLIDIQGRRGRINVMTKDVDIGPMTVTLADPRISGSDDMAERWFGQFKGDAEGLDRILECKVVIQVSDYQGRFPSYYTGRIKNARQKEGNQAVLNLVDVTRDAKFAAFVGGRVHPAVAGYAFRTPLMPFDLPQAWGSFTGVPMQRGVRRTPAGGWPRYILNPQDTTPRIYNSTMTRALHDLADNARVRSDGWLNPRAEWRYSPGKVYVKLTVGPTSGLFWLRFLTGLDDKDGQWHIDNLAVDEIPVSEGGMATPGVGTQLLWSLYPNADPSESSPLLVNDVPAARYVRDVLAGYFGPLRPDLTPKSSVPVDDESFDALEADATIPKVRDKVTGRAADRLKYLAEQVLKPRHLGLEPTPDGTMRLVDMRPTSGLLALGDAAAKLFISDVPAALAGDPSDLPDEMEPEGWRADADDAIPVISATWYRDIQFATKVIADGNEELPDVPGGRIETVGIPLERLDIRPRSLDFDPEPIKLDLKTVRASDTPFAGERNVAYAQATAIALADDLMAPFGAGGHYIVLTTRRNQKTEGFRMGTKVIVQVSTILDPFTKRWGGPVAAMILEKTERGAVLEFAMLALGSVVETDPPDLGPLVLSPGDDQHHNAQQQDVTPNTAGDPVVLEYAVIQNTYCDTGVAPITDVADVPDDAWRRLGTYTSLQDVDIGSLPSHSRIFTRARSEPNRSTLIGLPSAWVYPDAPGYVDTLIYASPNTGTGALLGAGSWLFKFLPGAGAEALPVEVRFGPGSAGVSLPAGQPYLRTLNPGDQQFRVDGLTPSTTYMMFMAHVDPFGGVSCYMGMELTTPADALVCPVPAGFRFQFAGNIVLNLFAADPAFDFHIQRASGTLTAPTGAWEDVIDGLPGSTRVYADSLPITDTIWWHRVRHTRPGWQPSAYIGPKAKRVEFDAGSGLPDFGGGSPDVMQDPQAILPVLTVQTTNDLTTGTLTATFTDPDSRVKRVEFQTVPGSTGVASAWVQDATAPYLATVAVSDAKTSYIRVRLIGYDAQGRPDQVLAETERAFPGRGVSGAANFALHTSDDLTLTNARVLTNTTEVTWDTATARQLKAVLGQVPTTKLRAPAGTTPGKVLTVQPDGTTIAADTITAGVTTPLTRNDERAAVAGSRRLIAGTNSTPVYDDVAGTVAINVATGGGISTGTPGDAPLALKAGFPLLIAPVLAAVTEHDQLQRKWRNFSSTSRIRVEAAILAAANAGAVVALQYSASGWLGPWRYFDAAQTGPFVSAAAVMANALGDWFALEAAAQRDNILTRWVTVGGDGVASLLVGNVYGETVSSATPPASNPIGPDGFPSGGLYGTLRLDLNVDAVAQADNTDLAPWNDASGFGNHGAAYASGTNPPKFRTNPSGDGRKGVVFTAASSHSLRFPMPSTGDFTLYYVIDTLINGGTSATDRYPNGSQIISNQGGGSGSSFGIALMANNKISYGVGENFFVNTTASRQTVSAAYNDLTRHVHTFRRWTTGGHYDYWKDGASDHPGGENATGAPLTEVPHAYIALKPGVGAPSTMTVRRIMWWDAKHEIAELTVIKNLLKTLWGTP